MSTQPPVSPRPSLSDQLRLALLQKSQNDAVPPPPPVPINTMPQQAMTPLPMPATPRVVTPDPAVVATQARLATDQSELRRQQLSGSGVQQITRQVDPQTGLPTGQKPSLLRRFGGVLARIGDTAESIVAPGVAALTPGTTLHHDFLMNQQAGRINNDLGDEQKQAQTAAQTEQTDEAPANDAIRRALEIAQAADYSAQAHDRLNPTAKPPASPFEAWARQNPNAKVSDWLALQSQNKPEKAINRDDHYISILEKPQSQWNLEDRAYVHAYRQYVKENKVDPGVQRAQIFVNGRAVQVANPDGTTSYDSAGNAMHNHEAGTQSIPFQTQKSTARDFTSGVDSRTLTAYNTAQQHLELLSRAADALQNGQLQAVNRISQEWAKQTGNPAPTNFDMVKAALNGEIAKTFTGGRATKEEVAILNAAIDKAQSPEQLRGVIAETNALMSSKRNMMKQQFDAGMQGRPNFGVDGSGQTGTRTYQGHTYVKGPNGWHLQQ